jgi:Mlc titration factor MtfA (ptsG expression regulator)
MPVDLRLRLEPVARAFLARVPFIGCNGLQVTDEMRVLVAVQACLLVVERDVHAYDELRSVLLYPDEFVVEERDEDESGIVTEGLRPLSGQTLDTSRIVLSWRDVLESGDESLVYNVVVHEFAHYLDHSVGGMLSAAGGAPRSLEAWHAVLEREYEQLCAAADRGEETLIDPYGAEDPAEFFAVAAETFVEAPLELEARHPALYRELAAFFGLDPARWEAPSPAASAPLS